MKTPSAIFVVGNSRSGTTLMGRILSQHPDVFTFNELHFFEQLWSSKDKGITMSTAESELLYTRLLRHQRKGYLSSKTDDSLIAEARADLAQHPPAESHRIFDYFMQQESIKNGKRIPCEQTPRNILYLNEIFELYPDAKVIIMVRDPRDVLLSQKRKWKRRFLGASNLPLLESIRSWLNYHPITISKLWNVNFSILQRYASHPRVHITKFEDLAKDPSGEVGRICTFLNLSFTPAMLEVPLKGSSNGKDISDLGISTKTVGNWHKGGLRLSEIFHCQDICRQGMEHLAYKVYPIKTSRISRIFNAVTFPVKLIVAFGFNLNRMKNIRESITRRLSIQKITPQKYDRATR